MTDQARLRSVIFVFGGLFHRKQHLRFDLKQCRSHHQKFTGDGKIQLLHRLDVAQILLSDQRDRDIVDVDLVLLDEVQQEVERALKVLDANLVGQLGLFGPVELVIHRVVYTSFGESEQEPIY